MYELKKDFGYKILGQLNKIQYLVFSKMDESIKIII
jgi:hypothetical protein